MTHRLLQNLKPINRHSNFKTLQLLEEKEKTTGQLHMRRTFGTRVQCNLFAFKKAEWRHDFVGLCLHFRCEIKNNNVNFVNNPTQICFCPNKVVIKFCLVVFFVVWSNFFFNYCRKALTMRDNVVMVWQWFVCAKLGGTLKGCRCPFSKKIKDVKWRNSKMSLLDALKRN